MNNNFIDELKASINIVDVIGRDVRLKKAGSNYKGLCPFHNEKTPSFMVSEQKQIFTCFGCGEKGDVIEYVKKRDGSDFMDAVQKLCDEYNIEMPAYNKSSIDYSSYYEINVLAARFFFKELTKAKNPAHAYLRKRGISDNTIAKFGLGYAPDSWDSLYNHLKSHNVSEEDMLKLGLIQKSNRAESKYYDKFRNRVIFPIFNHQGKIIGFGGRALGNDNPKYLNSSESEIFLKKNNLYALNFTKKDISDSGYAIIVEGYMDAISLYQSGIKNVAASLGTALTENQARLLSRFSKDIVLSYDSDPAGINAALRGIDVLRAEKLNVKILRVKDSKDPDEFVSRYGKDAFENLVKDSISGTDFKLELLESGFDFSDDLQVLAYIEKCVPILRSLGAVEQNIYVKKIANKFQLSEHAIELEIKTDKDKDESRSFNTASYMPRNKAKNVNSDLRLEMSLIVLAIYNSNYPLRYESDGIKFNTVPAKKIYGIVRDLASKDGYRGMEIDSLKIYEQLDPDDESLLKMSMDNIRIGPDEDEFYQECKSRFLLKDYMNKRIELVNSLQVAEKFENKEKLEQIVQELTNLDELIKKAKGGLDA